MVEAGKTANSVYFGESYRDPEHDEAVSGLLGLLDRADAENRAFRAETARLSAALVERDVEIRRLRSILDGWAMRPARVLWRIGRQSVSLLRRT